MKRLSLTGLMEIGYGIPNGLHENFENGKDIKMSEFEEGELVEMISKTKLGENSAVISKKESQETRPGTGNLVNKDSGRKKEKNRGYKGTPVLSIKDMSSFVTNVCKRLGERKSYLVWDAVACLGVSAVSDLVKEVEAILACGGQKRKRGYRILWNMIRARKPNAYKEIMKRGLEFEVGRYKEIMKWGKEFEKQLKKVPKTPLMIKEQEGSSLLLLPE